jgi:ABC-type branched-subunit amino acid transport system ATPase component
MISLLWPDGAPRQGAGGGRWAADLALDALVNALALSSRYTGVVRATLSALCTDPHTIAYRQAILADLLARPDLAAALEAALPALATAAAAGTSHWADEAAIFQVAGRVAELETYVGAVTGLHAALEAAAPPLAAAGWQALQADLAATTSSAAFQALAAELPNLRARLEQAGSVTLGINLDAQLRPESATLLSVNSERFSGPRSLIGRLLGGERNGAAGITPLRQANERQPFGPDRRLFLDLSELLAEVTRPIADALTRYAKISGAALAPLEGELAFYIGAARLIGALRAEGYALCRPEIAPPDERWIAADGLYNLDLALRLRVRPPHDGAPPAVIANDVRFNAQGRIFVLTGPNRGGKTTYTRAIGQALALAQAGLPVPAASARLSPVDAIYTLFPAAEQAQIGMGRLDEEAAQLAAIFRTATAHSLVLLNEPLGSTSPREAMLIARDVLGGLRMLGARALLVTHLHELAHEAEALNDAVAGESRIACLIAGTVASEGGDATRTYRIMPGTPDGRSYAVDIALAHGLELGQIEHTLAERGIR